VEQVVGAVEQAVGAVFPNSGRTRLRWAGNTSTAKGSTVAKPRLLGMAATVLAAGIALSGCAGKPGAAAIVDGQTISEQALAQSGRALQPFLQSQLTPSSMLSSMIQADVFLQVASEHGMGISAEEARDYLENIAEQAGIDAPESYPEGTLDVTRMLMATQKLSTSQECATIQQEVVHELSEMDVSISPRYGTWDPEGSSGSLVKEPSPDWLISSDDTPGTAPGESGSAGPGSGSESDGAGTGGSGQDGSGSAPTDSAG